MAQLHDVFDRQQEKSDDEKNPHRIVFGRPNQAQGEDRSDGLNQNGNDEQEFQHEAYRFQLSVSGARMFRRFSIWP